MIKIFFEKVWILIFAHPLLSRWNYYMLNLFQKALGINNYKSDKDSGEIYWINYVLKNYKIDTVFDVGAHTGEYSGLFRILGFSGKIYAFEPHPITYGILKERLREFDRNYCYNLGFSNKVGKQILFDHADIDLKHGTPHATLYPEVIIDMHKSKKISSMEISLNTIDFFVKENGIQKISLLKIDTEGNEYSILMGAKDMIKNDLVDIIQFEFGEMNVASRVFFKDFYDLLSEKYLLYRLLPNGLLPVKEYDSRQCEIFIYQNIVAISKKII